MIILQNDSLPLLEQTNSPLGDMFDKCAEKSARVSASSVFAYVAMNFVHHLFIT